MLFGDDQDQLILIDNSRERRLVVSSFIFVGVYIAPFDASEGVSPPSQNK